MSDWIEEADWSTVKVGDQVRARTDDGDQCTGKVEFIFMPSVIGEVARMVLDSPSLADLTDVRKDVWTLFVPAKPAVVLPTEVDVVVSWANPCYLGLAVLETDDQWLFHGENYTNAQMLEKINGQFITVLVPVAVTAKKVLDDVSKFAWADGFMPQLRTLGIKYGSIDE